MSGAASTENDPREEGATPPGLPDLALVPENERDQKWVDHYYQRGVPQLTVRAVVTGGVLGMFMSLANLYTTLHVGWSFGVAITSGVLAYAIWGVLGRIPGLSQMTLLENNCMQSTASAAGYSTGGTLATAVGAMLLIGGDEERLGWIPVGVWVFLTGVLGVFLAIPMKRQMINQEQLPFPSGIAAAATLRSLYAEGRESVLAARALIGSMVAGAVLAMLRDFYRLFEGFFAFPFRIFRVRGTDFTGATLSMGFEPSLLLIAAGMIVGLRVCTWMMVGALVNYTALMPWALSQPDWHEDGKTFFGHVESAALSTAFPVGSSEVDHDAIHGIANAYDHVDALDDLAGRRLGKA
jgi:putative OPT family oligopeptide transporter